MALAARISKFFPIQRPHAADLVLRNGWRRSVSHCSSAASIVDCDAKETSLDDPTLTPHQRMALALRRKKQESKRFKVLQSVPSSSTDIMESLRLAGDHASLKRVLDHIERNVDFLSVSTANIQYLVNTMFDRRMVSPPITLLVCSTLESRLNSRTDMPGVIAALHFVSRMDRVPFSTLKCLDEILCSHRAVSFPLVTIASAANIFANCREYPRKKQVMEQLAIRVNEHEVNQQLLSTVLRAFFPLHTHFLPRSFGVKVLTFLEQHFDQIFGSRPSTAIIAMRLVAQVPGLLTKGFAEHVLQTFESKLGSTQDVQEPMLRILSFLHQHVAAEQCQKFIAYCTNLDQRQVGYIASLLDVVGLYNLKLSSSQSVALHENIKQNMTELMERPAWRKSLLSYMSTVQDKQFWTDSKDIYEQGLADIHTLTPGNAVGMAAMVAKLPQVDARSLLHILNHLAIHLENEGGFKRLSSSDVQVLAHAVESSTMHIPRLMPGFYSYIDSVCSGGVSANPAEVALSFLSVVSRCGFLDDEMALSAVAKLEKSLTQEAVGGLDDYDLISLVTYFTHVKRMPLVLRDAFLDLVTNPTFELKSRNVEIKYRLIMILSTLQEEGNSRAQLIPNHLKSELEKVMVWRMCTLLDNARSTVLSGILTELVGSDGPVLADIVSKGYVINAALLRDTDGRLCSWDSVDFVSRLEVPTGAMERRGTDDIKVVDMSRALAQGYCPIGVVSVSRVLRVTNLPHLLQGIIRSQFNRMEADGWTCLYVHDDETKGEKRHRLAQLLSPFIQK